MLKNIVLISLTVVESIVQLLVTVIRFIMKHDKLRKWNTYVQFEDQNNTK